MILLLFVAVAAASVGVFWITKHHTEAKRLEKVRVERRSKRAKF